MPSAYNQLHLKIKNPCRLTSGRGGDPSKLNNNANGVNPQLQLCCIFLLKEVIQPQVPLGLPCYDFTPVTRHTLAACLLAVGSTASGTTNSRGVTGGVYKARERIHRGVLIRDY